MVIFIEGGSADSEELDTECRKGFRNLFEKCGIKKMPRLKACGSRNQALKYFKSELDKNRGSVALLIDSEDPVQNIDLTWQHLKKRDGWDKPLGATDEQVFFMATCMETWIVTDREALKAHYGACLQGSELPDQRRIEERTRDIVQDKLMHATRKCRNAYKKGKHSYVLVGKLSPDILSKHLPSFTRVKNILNTELNR